MNLPRAFTSRWVTVLVVLAMATLITDRHMEPYEQTTHIISATSHLTKVDRRSHEWSVVRTELDITLQIQRPAYSMKLGTPISIRRTGLLGDVIAYQLPGTRERWQPMETEKVIYRPLPYMILIGALLMLLRRWPEQVEQMIIALVLLTAFIWVLMLVASNGLKILDLFS